jgi:hypothetical protein
VLTECLLEFVAVGERSVNSATLRSLVSSTSTLLTFAKRHSSKSGSSNTGIVDELTTSSGESASGSAQPVSIAFGESLFVFMEVGPYLLVAQASASDRIESVNRIVQDVYNTIIFYLGSFSNLSQDDTILEGILVCPAPVSQYFPSKNRTAGLP